MTALDLGVPTESITCWKKVLGLEGPAAYRVL